MLALQLCWHCSCAISDVPVCLLELRKDKTVILLARSAPRVLDFEFGSSCEGSLVRVPNTSSMLFSHAGRIDNRIGRWNLTVWRSDDSGASWAPIEQVEQLNKTLLPQLHTAYSTMVALSGAPSSGPMVPMAIAYERGPIGNSHVTPSKCGEYATIRWKNLQLEDG